MGLAVWSASEATVWISCGGAIPGLRQWRAETAMKTHHSPEYYVRTHVKLVA
jgi:hypothetical protein